MCPNKPLQFLYANYIGSLRHLQIKMAKFGENTLLIVKHIFRVETRAVHHVQSDSSMLLPNQCPRDVAVESAIKSN